jgi:hypothetical protein
MKSAEQVKTEARNHILKGLEEDILSRSKKGFNHINVYTNLLNPDIIKVLTNAGYSLEEVCGAYDPTTRISW